MGNYFKYPGLGSLLDLNVSILDLCDYAKTDKTGYNPVFILKDDKSSYLYVDYFGIRYEMGLIVSIIPINNYNMNISIYKTSNGRKYIIYTYLNENVFYFPEITTVNFSRNAGIKFS